MRNKITNRTNSIFLFYRPETNIRISSTQIQEKVPVRENIHSEAILNLYPVDTSNFLTASQDRV